MKRKEKNSKTRKEKHFLSSSGVMQQQRVEEDFLFATHRKRAVPTRQPCIPIYMFLFSSFKKGIYCI